MTDHWEDYVASLDDDEEADSALHYEELEYAGPPVAPLDFPTPTIFPAWVMSVRAIDHRNGKNRILDNVLLRAPTTRSPQHGGNPSREEPQRAFLIRKKITTTTYGSIRVAVVLRRRDEDEPRADILPWISTEELVAVKISSWHKMRQSRGHQSKLSQDDPMREAAALQHVGNYNPHVMGCVDVLQCENHLYTVMPYFSQGSNLHSRLFGDPGETRHPPPSEDEARSIFRQLLKGLLHLQRKGVHHRDISLNNLLISKSNQLKLVDLGMSLRVPYSDPCNEDGVTDVAEGTTRRLFKPQGKGGQLMYQAPEVLKGNRPFDGYAVDLWAAGVVLFVLCVGLAPFKFAALEEKRYVKISSGGLAHLLKNLRLKVSPEACDLIQNMLWENPRRRLSLAEVMKHPWVMGNADQIERPLTPPELDSGMPADVSIGSEGSTEDVQGEHPLISKAAARRSTVAASVRAESRDSVSELRDSTRPSEGVHHKVNQGLKHLQQIGPKLKSNAQQMGPRLVSNAQRIGPRMKNAIANVHIHNKGNTPPGTDPNDGADVDEGSSSISPRRMLNRITNRATSPKTS